MEIETTDWQKNQLVNLLEEKRALANKENFILTTILDSKGIDFNMTEKIDFIEGKLIIVLKSKE